MKPFLRKKLNKITHNKHSHLQLPPNKQTIPTKYNQSLPTNNSPINYKELYAR